MSEQTGQRELRELISVSGWCSLSTTTSPLSIRQAASTRTRARSLFTEDVRLKHEIAVLEGIEEVAAAIVWSWTAGNAPSTSAPTIALNSMASTPI